MFGFPRARSSVSVQMATSMENFLTNVTLESTGIGVEACYEAYMAL